MKGLRSVGLLVGMLFVMATVVFAGAEKMPELKKVSSADEFIAIY